MVCATGGRRRQFLCRQVLGCLGPSAHPCMWSQPWDEGLLAKSQQSYSDLQEPWICVTPSCWCSRSEVSDQVTLHNSIIFEPECRWLKTVPFLKGLKCFSLVPAKGKKCCWLSTANTSPNCPSVLYQLKMPRFKLLPPHLYRLPGLLPLKQLAGFVVAMVYTITR